MKRGANLLNNTKQQVANQRIKKMIPYVTHVSYGIFCEKDFKQILLLSW